VENVRLPFTKLLTVYSAAFVIALVGWLLNVSQLYWMAGALILLPRVTRLLAQVEHRGLSVRRQLPAAAHQGDAVRVRFHVRNLTWMPKLNLSVADELPAGLSASDPQPTPIQLAPHGADEGEYLLQLRRRGAHTLETIQVISADLLGLYTIRSRVASQSHILVYPRITSLPPEVLPADWGGGQDPMTEAQRRGEGTSFSGIRDYRPGDPLRHIHWRSAARLRKLAVVEWEDEESTSAVVAVETLRGSDRSLTSGSTTLDLAAGLAASLASVILAKGGALRLLTPGVGEWRAASTRGVGVLPELLETLARMTAESPSPLAAELQRIGSDLAPGTLVCWITATPDEHLLATVRWLRSAHLRPVVYAILPAGGAGSHSDGQAGGLWDGAAAELERAQVPVIRIAEDDELARRLLE